MDPVGTIEIGEIKIVLGKEDSVTTNQKMNQPSSLNAKLKVHDDFQFNQEVKVKVINDGKESILFRGNIYSAHANGQFIELFGYDKIEEMKHLKFSGLFLKFNHQDIARHLFSLLGFKSEVHNCNFDKVQRKFFFLLPVFNFPAKEEIKFKQGKILPKIPEDIKIIISENEKFSSFFIQENASYLSIETIGIDFIEGYQKALIEANKIMDKVYFKIKFSQNRIDSKLLDWNKHVYDSSPRLGEWFFGKVEAREEMLFINSSMSLEPDLSKLLELDWSNDWLKEKLDLATEKDLSDLLAAIHWMRRSRTLGENKDRLLDCFTSFEFILHQQEVNQLFTPEDKKAIKEILSEKLDGEKFERIKSTIDNINNPSLMFKLDAYLKKYSINLSSGEIEHLKKMRAIRNDLEHGDKENQVTEDDITGLLNVLEKLILGRLRHIN